LAVLGLFYLLSQVISTGQQCLESIHQPGTLTIKTVATDRELFLLLEEPLRPNGRPAIDPGVSLAPVRAEAGVGLIISYGDLSGPSFMRPSPLAFAILNDYSIH
jgi:hypothetical protein